MKNQIDRFNLTPEYSISRVIKGGWHLAGGHGRIDEAQAIKDMADFVKAGITTFDCADIYTGVESLIGRFLAQYKAAFKAGELPAVQIHTKYVPDYGALATLRQKDTEAVIDRSLMRLGVERLDLVQFAWWNYDMPGYIEAAHHLVNLQKKGKIRYLGLTNFDGQRVGEFIRAGVPLVTHQVQYSVLDHRPETDLELVTGQEHLPLLAYGVLAGGFLSERYVGVPEPKTPLENRSLVKYKLIIDECGNWSRFQELLAVLQKIGERYGVSPSEAAMQYVLQKPGVAGVIVGVRHGRHLPSLKRLNTWQLDSQDLKDIQEAVDRHQGPQGPVYSLERDKDGPHGAIMKYNLNQQRS